MYRFPANYDCASIAFFSVSLARPVLPLLTVTFSPSKDSRRGSSRRITAYKSPTMSLEFSVTRRDVYSTYVYAAAVGVY